MPLQFVQKRTDTRELFDQKKVTQSIWRAAKSLGGTDHLQAERMGAQVSAVLHIVYQGQTPTTQHIREMVEKVLLEMGHTKTARAYMMYNKRLADERVFV